MISDGSKNEEKGKNLRSPNPPPCRMIQSKRDRSRINSSIPSCSGRLSRNSCMLGSSNLSSSRHSRNSSSTTTSSNSSSSSNYNQKSCWRWGICLHLDLFRLIGEEEEEEARTSNKKKRAEKKKRGGIYMDNRLLFLSHIQPIAKKGASIKGQVAQEESPELTKLSKHCPGRDPVLLHHTLYMTANLTYLTDFGGIVKYGRLTSVMGTGKPRPIRQMFVHF